jgi:hypothetical protein
LKGTGFEIIPEEDEERMKTEYNTSRRVFKDKTGNSFKESCRLSIKKEENITDNINKESLNSEILKSIEDLKSSENLGILNDLKNLDNNNSKLHIARPIFKGNNVHNNYNIIEQRSITPKNNNNHNANIITVNSPNLNSFNNEIKKSGSLIKIRPSKQPIKPISKEKSIEDPICTTTEATITTLSSAKTRKTFSTPEDPSTKSPLTSKEKIKKSFTFRESMKINANNNYNKNINSTEEDRPLTGTLSSSNKNNEPVKIHNKEESERNISYNNYSSNNYSNSTTPETSSIKPARNASKSKTDFKKPFTPPDNNKLKLPIINTNRRKIDINNDINNIFQNASNFKEDPVIKKKLDDIIQNIADIKNVLNQKTKARLKISSAPGNYNTNDDKFTFSPDKNPFQNTFKDEKNITFSRFNINNNSKAIINTTNLTTGIDTRRKIVKQVKEKERVPAKLVKK